MATKLFLRSTQNNGLGPTYFDMVTAAGAAATTAVVNSAASGTEIQWTQSAGGAALQFVSGRAPSGGFTLTTTDISIWAHESNGQANCGGRYRVFRRTAAGVETEIGGGPFNDGVEFGTAAAEMLWAGNVTDQAFAENDRILLKLYITNIGTMGGSRTCTLTFNGANGASGDSFFNIAETVAFKAESVTGPTGMASQTDSSIGLGAARPAGLAADTEIALALAVVIAGPVGLALEAEAALALQLGGSPVGMVSEADAALALAAIQISPVGLAGGACSAVARGSARPAGIGAETGTARALGASRPVGAANDSGTAHSLGSASLRPVGAAQQAEAALPLTGVTIAAVGLATGECAALALSAGTSAPVGMAIDASEAEALAAIQALAAGMAAENDNAFGLVPPGTVGAANENDMALALGHPIYCPPHRSIAPRREKRIAGGKPPPRREARPNLPPRRAGG